MIRPNANLLIFAAIGGLFTHELMAAHRRPYRPALPISSSAEKFEREKTPADLAAIAKAQERRRRKAERKAREQLARQPHASAPIPHP